MKASPESMAGPTTVRRTAHPGVGLLLLFLLLTLVSGCRAWAIIPVRELMRLDGYRRGDIINLSTKGGGRYPINPRTVLVFQMQDGSSEKFVFADIRITETELTGSTVQGGPVVIRLQDIGEVWAVHRRTGLLVGLILVGILAVPLVWLTTVYVVVPFFT